MKTNLQYVHGKRWWLLIMFVAWFAVLGNGWTATNYVSLDGSDANAGSSWAEAFLTISNAVARAGDGSVTNTIMVSNGTYVLSAQIDIKKPLALISLSGADTTIINGNYPNVTNRCLQISASNVVVDGFTISNGHPTTWGGGFNIPGTGTVKNCIIRDNTANASAGGGGVYAAGVATISNCMVAYNVSSNNQGAGGIQMGAYGLVEKCRIIGNSALGGANGGGLALSKNTVVKNCLIQDNYTAGKGGGISFDTSCSYPNLPSIQNCTIVSNTSVSSGGGLYFMRWTGSVVNTIVFLNSGASTQSNLSSIVGAAYTNCCIGVASPSGFNVTNLNPRFVDPLNGNYHLAADSPYINWGMNQPWMLGAQDIDGKTRIDRFSGIVDLGAYEFIPRGILFSVR